MKTTVKVYKEFISLCSANKFAEAGELARANKQIFIDTIKNKGVSVLPLAYRVCHIFNMRQTDCFNLVFTA